MSKDKALKFFTGPELTEEFKGKVELGSVSGSGIEVFYEGEKIPAEFVRLEGNKLKIDFEGWGKPIKL